MDRYLDSYFSVGSINESSSCILYLVYQAQQYCKHITLSSKHSTLKVRAALLQMPAARQKLLISELHKLHLLIIPSGIAQRCVVAIHTQGLLETTSPLFFFSRIVAVVHVLCALAVVVGGGRRPMQSRSRRGTSAADIFAHPRAQPARFPNLSVAARSRGGVCTGGVGLGVRVGVPRYLGRSRVWSAFVTLSASCFRYSTWGRCRSGSFVVAPHHHLKSIVSSHPCSNNSMLMIL